MNFQSDININAKVYENSVFYKDAIFNKTQKISQFPISEVKYMLEDETTIITPLMYYVDDEVFDDGSDNIIDIQSYKRSIGTILHFHITAVKKYVEYTISLGNNILEYNKSLIDGSIEFKLLLAAVG